MQCPRCRHDAPPDATFCSMCGGGLGGACPRCAAVTAPSDNFCRRCGQRLTTEEGPESGRIAAPESYTPRYLAEKILTSRGALEGERKQVTVLFADVRGSMELIADRDPEEVRKVLDPVLALMMEAVHRYDGTVNQVMGDGIMALFGAPVAHEDHAIRACYAALALQAAIRRLAAEARRAHGVEAQVRVGLNSGEVVVRTIGSDLRMDYTAVGQTTHLAARMEQLATPGTIRLTAETFRLAEGFVQVKPLGPVPITGLPHPVEVLELLGAAPTRTRMHVAATRGLTRLVGRDAELETLRQALERARGGHGQVVALVGEPGVGKSRLLWELSHSRGVEGWLLLESGAFSYGRATPYLPVIDLLKTYFQVEPRDDARTIREKVAGRLLTLDRALEPMLPAFLALLDVPTEDAQWDALDPPQRRQRTLEAFKRLLLRESQGQPLCLVFEDLHWIDSETQAVLDSLVEGLPSACLLLLVSYRPEYKHRWTGKTYYAQLRIDPLPPDSAERLLDALLGDPPELQPLKRHLIERTEGNPFFLEESVRTLVETQVLLGGRGRYRLAKPVETVQVPATVQAVLAARIDRLDPEDKRILQSASIIGETVPVGLLQAVAEMPEADLRLGLSRLQSAEFLYEASLFPELQYTFKHGLTYRVTYDSILGERRCALHARTVDALERLYRDRLAEHVERLAYHARRAERWDRAVTYLHQAGLKAMTRSAHREAAGAFEEGLAALDKLGESPERMQAAIDFRLALRNALQPLGEFERILSTLQEARRLAEALGDPRQLGRVSAYVADYLRLTADYPRAVEMGERALALAGRLDDVALEVAGNTYVGQTYYLRGAYARAAGFFQRNIERLTGPLLHERFGLGQVLSVHSRTCLVWCLAELGEFTRGAELGSEGIAIAESLEHPLTLITAYSGLGAQAFQQGDVARALPLLERATALCRTSSTRLWLPRAASTLGLAYAHTQRVGEALPLLEEALEEAASMGLRAGTAALVARLAEAELLADRAGDALARVTHALALARVHGEQGHEARALELLARILAALPSPDLPRAEATYRDARARAAALGMRPLVAQCQAGLAEVARLAGRHAEAARRLVAARSLFAELGMRAALADADAGLRALGSP